MYRNFNPNPHGSRVGDCVVRAISAATNRDWIDVYVDLAIEGLLVGDLPNSNAVWGAYLKRLGYRRGIIPDTCPDCYTVRDFAADHPKGCYILGLNGHVVCVKDGDYHDTWDSGNERPIYYWHKEE